MVQVVIVQRYFYNFREGIFDCLKSMNLDFVLINSTKSRGRVKVHQDKVENVDYIYKTTNFNLANGIVVFPFLLFALFKLRPKIIVSEGGQNTINNLTLLVYRALTNTPLIIWDLGKGYQDFGNSFARRIYMKIYKCILNKSALVYGYNSSSKEYFMKVGVPKEKILVLNNTIDTIKLKKVINQSIKTAIPADISNYNPDKTYLIFVGTLLPTKSIEDFKLIMNRIGSNYHLLLIGDGNPEYVSKLKHLFSDINCSFLGYKREEELLSYYRLASFTILPGLGGLAINQSMAFSVPVLCSKADGAECDIVKNGETGFIYSTIDELIGFIKSQSNEDWKRMGKNASNILYGTFSIENECTLFVDGINKVVNGIK